MALPLVGGAIRVSSLGYLGYWGSSPGAKRYFVEFRDGHYFTFMGDTYAMARLAKVREDETRASRAEVS